MRWSNYSPPRWHRTSFYFLTLCGSAVVFLYTIFLAGAPEQKRVSVYSTVANYSVPVIERNGLDYAGLIELLDPLGTITVKPDRSHWKLIYNNVNLEFTGGKTRARIQGSDFDLPANFIIEDGRGLVPLASLGTLLSRILGGPVTFHDASRRLFIGSVATHFTASVNSINPPRLEMNFSSAVNPAVNQEQGKLHLMFSHEPLVAPGSPQLTFGNPTIPSASYREDNGTAEITVVGTVPLSASFSNNGRTITVMPAAQTAASQNPAPVISAAPTPAPPTPWVRRYFAVIDASHGGSERGAALTDQLAEKDVTLAFGRRLRQELAGRGIPALLIRDGDTTLSLDQRANFTNATHPAIYICLHAASQGSGVRIYTALLPPTEDNRGPFLDWNTAQSGFRNLSQTAEAGVAAQLQRSQIPVRTLVAALRPLNNITTAAIAVEIAPPQNDVSELASASYQQSVSYSIATGIAAIREKLEASR